MDSVSEESECSIVVIPDDHRPDGNLWGHLESFGHRVCDSQSLQSLQSTQRGPGGSEFEPQLSMEDVVLSN